MKKIIIEQGNEFKIYSREMDISEDIFSEQYQQANDIKDNLILNCEMLKKDGGSQNIWEHLNNLIAFCGDRGQGKSSAMVQFTNSLRLDENIEVLETIDPTAMETVHDILDIVISRMFEQYRKDKEQADRGEDDSRMPLDRDRQLKMSSLFQKVHKNLAVLKNSDKFIESEYIYNGSIQNLMDIADSMKLKQDVNILVEEYLKYRNKKMLVVSLDDLDLNISAAYKMMEQIRKYMMLPQIIIVMAVNLNQLSLCVERQFLLDMKGLENSVRWNMDQEARKMGNKYLEKLLPLPRRITLPDIRTISSGGDSAVEIIYKNDKSTIFDSRMLGIEKGLLRLLYKRTGLLLVAREDEVHPLIPATLRELVSIVSVIGSMEEENERRNLELFEDYLFDFWADNHLAEEEWKWFLSLREAGVKGVHNAVLLHLYDWWKKRHNESTVSRRKSVLTLAENVKQNALKIRSTREEASNGSVLDCIRLCYREEDNGMDKLFFAVSSYVSILMLKLKYDHAEEKLLDFIGNSVFGSYQLIREESGTEVNQSRTSYEYKLVKYWKNHAKTLGSLNPAFSKTMNNANVSTVREYYSQFVDGDKALWEGLYAVGCVSEFSWGSDSTAEGMVSDNNVTAAKAAFSLNWLFIRQMEKRGIYQNINAEKWGIPEAEELKNMIFPFWEHFRELCGILVCNMEAVNYIGQYLEDTRRIKDGTNHDIKAYYKHFFESLVNGMIKLDQYLDLEVCWIKKEICGEEYNQLAGVLAEFWESRGNDDDEEEGYDENISKGSLDTPSSVEALYELFKDDDDQPELPSSVRKDSSFANFRYKLGRLESFFEEQNQNDPKIGFNEVAKELESLKKEFESYEQMNADKKVIGDTLSREFNNIRRKLLD